MVKILLPTNDYLPATGGVARYLYAVKQCIPEMRVDVFTDGFPKLFSLVKYALNQPEEEIWTSHVLPIGTAFFISSFFKKRPYVVFLHGLDFDLARRNIWKRFLAKCILRRARKIVANTQALAREVMQFTRREDVITVYPCVSDEFVDISQRVRKGFEKPSLQELTKMMLATTATLAGVSIAQKKPHATSSYKLLTVARLISRKGHRKVIDALQYLPHAIYTIVGDGPLRDELIQYVKERHLSDRVTFLTDISDAQLPEVYAAHDVFVMPVTQSATDREGFGIVYAEAGLFGLPVIATRSAGVDEVVIDGVTGYLIDDTPQSLLEALQHFEKDLKLARRIGVQGREYVLSHFTVQQMKECLRTLV